MGWTAIAHTSKAGNASGAAVTTNPIDTNTIKADLVVLGSIEYNGTVLGAPSDSASNSWGSPAINAPDGTNGYRTVLYFLHNPNTSASHTFTWTPAGSPGYAPIIVAAFSGSAASPLDQVNSAIAAGAETSQAAGNILTGRDNELIVTILGQSTAPISGVSINFTPLFYEDSPYVSSTSYGIHLAPYVQPSAGNINMTWSWTTSVTATALVASFMAAAGAPMPCSPGSQLLLGVACGMRAAKKIEENPMVTRRSVIFPAKRLWTPRRT